jgi:hypothetical protein
LGLGGGKPEAKCGAWLNDWRGLGFVKGTDPSFAQKIEQDLRDSLLSREDGGKATRSALAACPSIID